MYRLFDLFEKREYGPDDLGCLPAAVDYAVKPGDQIQNRITGRRYT
jgi:hypothetical protein